MRKVKRASYAEAVEWIAMNDEPEDMDAESVASFVSTCLVADLWGKDTIVVAADVVKVRRKANIKPKTQISDFAAQMMFDGD